MASVNCAIAERQTDDAALAPKLFRTGAPKDRRAERYLISGGWLRSIGGMSICGTLICTLLGSIVDSPAL